MKSSDHIAKCFESVPDTIGYIKSLFRRLPRLRLFRPVLRFSAALFTGFLHFKSIGNT